MSQKKRVAVLGASGYTGAETVRLLAAHPHVEIVILTAERKAGQALGAVFPHLAGLALPDLIHLDDVEWHGAELDAVICALPHVASQEVVGALFHATEHTVLDDIVGLAEPSPTGFEGQVRVLDLSADFRLTDAAAYEEWYGRPHQAPKLQTRAVYALPERNRAAIRNTALAAMPGCYPTAALLALLPLVDAGQIDVDDIAIDAKSGVSGAGRSLKEQNLYCEVGEAMHPYAVGRHRHMPEMEQELGKAAGRPVRIGFTPHLVPMNRGELETIYVRLSPGHTAEALKDTLRAAYAEEPFVTVLPGDLAPATRMVRGSNQCVLNVFEDRRAGRAIVVAAIDNLIKGAGGQAVQAMNIMFGWDETTGLTQAPLFP
ncbi:N-acetyl-gamma-glutamyl-phosphate reductase [Rhodothalassium salexigens DSM 2132]|uniref:N-acetyl-gamma-glutamyl-phosphate reductase n=1 Tax=Rhodothalassium salexigens DSM 2132 TaxID=1188247 RepID=A0A4R2PU70_RHOSA|nr:N-acetyl-gamma-glutamyl-phosphate reductase [Rhodothalassium salexigens]MBB4210769.1 N-acetyl-gamma-glutamyl-phosphate reductase [Rhodothalassium salexigens DSM 2132]MBK1638251.1 N-acetyl-gamma-glutamyl-phosphate reductase [Rhodothalassium salexigens DSM 2132]TCP37675.1 N-acetyl-gamma-glutamyl-phosphate reductase [Rhodothalassium salexigens DSM 2132]